MLVDDQANGVSFTKRMRCDLSLNDIGQKGSDSVDGIRLMVGR